MRRIITSLTLAASLFAMAQTGRAWAAGCIDLNKASVAQLTQLDGIGTKKAERTVQARPFRSLSDWSKRVYGVGPKTVQANAARICRLGGGR